MSSSFASVFRSGLLQSTRDIDTRIVLQMQRIVTPSVENIFVPLTVRRNSPSGIAAAGATFLEEARVSGDLSEEVRRKLLQSVRSDDTGSVSRTVPEILAEHTHNIILGDPGAGKSTLMRWLVQGLLGPEGSHARRALEPAFRSRKNELWPIPVTLRYYAQAVADGGMSFRDFLAEAAWSASFGHTAAQAGAFALEKIEEGNALFLLDGFDEAIDAGLRRKLVDSVSDFLRAAPGCHSLTTSRIIGYDLAPFPENFAAWKLEPFTPRQTAEFFGKWSLLIEREEDLPGQNEDAFMLRRAKLRSDSILEGMGFDPEACEDLPPPASAGTASAQAHIRQLASNPMLCTLIGLIHHQGKQLPDDRAELYRLCLEAFVFDWEVQKRIRQIEKLSLDKFETLDVLEELAFHLHRDTSANVLSTEKIGEIIVTFLREEKGLSPALAAERAANQLSIIRDRSGILVARGEDLFGFSHLQFQEYLAGRALVRRRSEIPKLLAEHLWETRWEESIVLTAAYRAQHSEEAATEFIEAVRATPPPARFSAKLKLESLLHRALFMAARCLADAKRVHFRTANGIIEELNAILRDASRPYLWKPAIQAAGCRKGALDLRFVFSNANAQEIHDLLIPALTALGVAARTEAQHLLLSVLGNEKLKGVHYAAVASLETLLDSSLFGTLESLFETEDDSLLRASLFSLLCKTDLGAAFELALKDYKAAKYLKSAIRYVDRLPVETLPTVLTSLRLVMETHDDFQAIATAAAALLAQGEQFDCDRLLAVIKERKSEKEVLRALAILSGAKYLPASTAVVQLIMNKSSVAVERAAWEALKTLATPSLIVQLADDLAVVKPLQLIDLLAEFTFPEVEDITFRVLSLVENPVVFLTAAISPRKFTSKQMESLFIRKLSGLDVEAGGAAIALGKMEAPEAVEPLLRVLKKSGFVQTFVIGALGAIRSDTPVPRLAKMLADVNHESVWSTLHYSLIKIISR